MQRREFLTVAGVGAGAMLSGGRPAQAAEQAAEKRLQVYKCEECGAIVEILEPGANSLVHCAKPMTLLKEIREGAGAPKHLPVIEKIDGGYKVTVGATPHPMLEAHHISWIDLIADGKIYRQFLKVGDKPEAVFLIDAKEVSARAECNLHGLWRKSV
jgi:superoxide reductase